MTSKELVAFVEEAYPDHTFLFVDGHDNAFLGVATGMGKAPCTAYSREQIIQNLQTDMDRDEAEEFFEFNIAGAYVGHETPCFVDEL